MVKTKFEEGDTKVVERYNMYMYSEEVQDDSRRECQDIEEFVQDTVLPIDSFN